MNNESLKKLAVITAISVLLFWVFKPKGNGEKSGTMDGSGTVGGKINKPSLPEDQLQDETVRNAYEALCAYIDAANDGESSSTLDLIKKDIKDKMGLVIYSDASGKLAVKDIQGNDILVNG